MTNGMPAVETHVDIAAPAAQAPGFLRLTWTRWKQIAKAVGVVQTRLLMVFFYFVFVFPLGLIIRRSGDPLHLKAPSGSNWTPHRQEPASLDAARRQF